MMKLSVVIITFNEEKNIEACLKSVQDVADEIVVMDSFSTDRTEEICRKYPVKFIQNPFEGYIQQKNAAAENAQGDYILSMDADERLDEELKNEILKVKKNPQFSAYRFNRMTYYNGRWIKHSGWYPDVKLRLWKKGAGNWGGRNPHDRFVLKEKQKIKHLKGNLLHYSFYSIEEHMAQANKFSGIMARTLFEEGKKVSTIKVYFAPIVKFLRDYVKNMGFFDGQQGLTICRINAMETYLRYAKLKELYRQEKLKKLNN